MSPCRACKGLGQIGRGLAWHLCEVCNGHGTTYGIARAGGDRRERIALSLITGQTDNKRLRTGLAENIRTVERVLDDMAAEQ